MTKEQLEQYFETHKEFNEEADKFYNEFKKPDVDYCTLRLDNDDKSLIYSFWFLDTDGRTFRKSYTAKEFMDFEVVYNMLKKEFYETYASEVEQRIKKDIEWHKSQLEECEANLAKIHEKHS